VFTSRPVHLPASHEEIPAAVPCPPLRRLRLCGQRGRQAPRLRHARRNLRGHHPGVHDAARHCDPGLRAAPGQGHRDREPVQGGLPLRLQGRLWRRDGQEGQRSLERARADQRHRGERRPASRRQHSRDATPKLLFNRRFNIGVDAKAIAGPKVAEKESNDEPIIAAPVLVYSKALGLYAGATIKSGQLARSDDENYVLYNTKYTMPELLYSDWVQPPAEVQPLMAYMQKIAP
jgi:hypothetical protein